MCASDSEPTLLPVVVVVVVAVAIAVAVVAAAAAAAAAAVVCSPSCTIHLSVLFLYSPAFHSPTSVNAMKVNR